MFYVFKISARYVCFVLVAVVCTMLCFIKTPGKANAEPIGAGTIPAEAASTGQLSSSPKTVYLTFDDGPSENTPHLLDVLKKNNVPASFFLVGPVEKVADDYEELLKRIAAEGHTVAPHSYSHNYKQIYSSKEAFFTDYDKISNTIQEVTGQISGIYRFPGGSVNREAPPQVINQVVSELENREIIFYDWNIVSGDDTAVVYSPQTLYNNVVKNISRFQNAVVLFHDASLCSTTADAVDLLIPELKKQGWKFEAITKDTKPIQYHPPSNKNKK